MIKIEELEFEERVLVRLRNELKDLTCEINITKGIISDLEYDLMTEGETEMEAIDYYKQIED